MNGNFYFKARILKPYKLPVLSTQYNIARYINSNDSWVIYDADLGWSNRPNSTSKNGLYRINDQGIRIGENFKNYSTSPEKGVLRIALLGDSFTLGADVKFEHTWGYYLECILKKSELNTEVINLGGAGYGMGQAFLNWRKNAYKFNPDIVIFGFQAENTYRNLSILRPVYHPRSGLPLSKPRFIMNGDALQVINVPAVPPQEVAATIKNIKDWDLAEFEYMYDPDDYEEFI